MKVRLFRRFSVFTEIKEDESGTGGVWAAGLHHVTALFFRLARVLKLLNVFFIKYFISILDRGKPRKMNHSIRGNDCIYRTALRQFSRFSMSE
jgi:hypothetical protein